jgi:predicted regulator of Ras-like GTPase activity (Roadblock/LC7/MglB family)
VSGSPLDGTLAALRDVPGVQGSFAVSELGRLFARDMPPLFGDDVLSEVGPRALRLRETFMNGQDELLSCIVRYSDFLLFLRPLRDGLLCVLTAEGVNVPSLKMAMTLASRRLSAVMGEQPTAPLRKTPASPAPAVPHTDRPSAVQSLRSRLLGK